MASKYGNWENVITEVSKNSTIFSYNRPRIGESENDSIPPTPKHIVENLRKMLVEKDLKPPYLFLEIGLTQHQIDSMFAKPHEKFKEKLFYAEMPNFYVEEVKISSKLNATEF